LSVIINPDTYIDQNLRAQIQQISQELFYIQIKQKESGRIVFYTGERAEPNDSLQSADMWYVPGYELGIRLKSKTLTDLASERTQRDNYLLLGIGILVILGFLFVIFNIRKEIKLAELKSEFVSNVSHEIRTPLALNQHLCRDLAPERKNRTKNKKNT
jgi:two-component system phosphate regulon sensor histidine kinase PhoR